MPKIDIDFWTKVMVHKLHFTEYQDSMHPIVCGYWTIRLDSSLESVVYEQQIPQ